MTDRERLFSLCDDLADMAVAGEEIGKIVERILASGDTDSLLEEFGSLEAELTHIAWHMRSLRRNLAWVMNAR
ncbi:MAG: hypothetical protein H5U04_03940 [Firmicutes bacterium]|nr:hypothetical protein [Bacillota bacterium]